GDRTPPARDHQLHPALNYRHLSNPWDRKRLHQGIRLALQLCAHPAFKDIIVEQVSLTPADLASDAALHACVLRNRGGAGVPAADTCKMGPASDPMAVVDQFCHIRGLEGLRVVD